MLLTTVTRRFIVDVGGVLDKSLKHFSDRAIFLGDIFPGGNIPGVNFLGGFFPGGFFPGGIFPDTLSLMYNSFFLVNDTLIIIVVSHKNLPSRSAGQPT